MKALPLLARVAACLVVLTGAAHASADDYIVKTRPRSSLRTQALAAKPLPAGRPLRRGAPSAGARTMAAGHPHPFDAYRVISVQSAAELAELERHPDVEWIEPDLFGQGGGLPDDTYMAEQWSLVNTGQGGGTPGADINAEAGWAVTTGSPDIVVAVLDTGIDLDHPEFLGRIVPGYDFVNDDDDPTADHSHGVLASGILLANANNGFGVAGIDHHARLMPLKVLDAQNRGSTSNLAAALIHAADQGARVVSMSLINYPCGSTALRDALQYARDAGVVLVSSAGNGGEGNADVSAPGCFEQVISVGATSRDDTRASFSATGQALDLVAPGSGVITAAYGTHEDQRNTFGGTSAAAPHVAGVASLMLAVDPSLTHDDIKAILESTADDQVGDADDLPGWDDYYGWGRLNMGAALASLQQGDGDVDQTATGEDAARVTATGTLSDTFQADGVVYTLRETTEGFWVWQTTALEQVFYFDVRGGSAVTFELLARRDGDAQDDHFLLQYSTDDGESWTDMFVVDHTAFETRRFELPADTAGALAVRAIDSDADGDARETALIIDHMFVRSTGEGGTCQQAPSAAFGADVQAGPAPLSVRFSDASTGGATRWLWDFGDGSQSSEQHPVHRYEAPGSYTVTLTVTNDCGEDQLVQTDFITVEEACPLPRADFRAGVTRGPAPLEVAFSDASQDAAEWAWDFGDGATSSDPNPTHTYTEPGVYDVTLVVTNRCGQHERVARGYVEVTATCELPTAAFDAEVKRGAAPLEVAFTDRSIDNLTSWRWDFGDGATSSEQHPVHVYTAAGTYSVRLTVTNACGEDSALWSDMIQVDEPTGGAAAHVASLEVSAESNWWLQRGVATVRVVDEGGAPVEGAQVTAEASGPAAAQLRAVTDADGYATVRTEWSWGGGTFCFEVLDVAHDSLPYDPDADAVGQVCE